MTHAKKLAERLRARARLLDAQYQTGARLALELLADEIERGDFFGDILGGEVPTLDDVREEAVRVLGERASVGVTERGMVVISRYDHDSQRVYVSAPTIAAAYAALRALPDKEPR